MTGNLFLKGIIMTPPNTKAPPTPKAIGQEKPTTGKQNDYLDVKIELFELQIECELTQLKEFQTVENNNDRQREILHETCKLLLQAKLRFRRVIDRCGSKYANGGSDFLELAERAASMAAGTDAEETLVRYAEEIDEVLREVPSTIRIITPRKAR